MAVMPKVAAAGIISFCITGYFLTDAGQMPDEHLIRIYI